MHLAELHVQTGQRNKSQIDTDLQIAVYLRNLLPYPADLVREFFLDYSKDAKWWPDMFDIYAEIEEPTKRRRMHLEALKGDKNG